jgi:hypothetical protein
LVAIKAEEEARKGAATSRSGEVVGERWTGTPITRTGDGSMAWPTGASSKSTARLLDRLQVGILDRPKTLLQDESAFQKAPKIARAPTTSDRGKSFFFFRAFEAGLARRGVGLDYETAAG